MNEDSFACFCVSVGESCPFLLFCRKCSLHHLLHLFVIIFAAAFVVPLLAIVVFMNLLPYIFTSASESFISLINPVFASTIIVSYVSLVKHRVLGLTSGFVLFIDFFDGVNLGHGVSKGSHLPGYLRNMILLYVSRC